MAQTPPGRQDEVQSPAGSPAARGTCRGRTRAHRAGPSPPPAATPRRPRRRPPPAAARPPATQCRTSERSDVVIGCDRLNCRPCWPLSSRSYMCGARNYVQQAGRADELCRIKRSRFYALNLCSVQLISVDTCCVSCEACQLIMFIAVNHSASARTCSRPSMSSRTDAPRASNWAAFAASTSSHRASSAARKYRYDSATYSKKSRSPGSPVAMIHSHISG